MLKNFKQRSITLVIMCFIVIAFCTPPVLAFSISDIPNNTLKLGDDFFDLSSNPMSDPNAVIALDSLLKDGPNKNVAYFKFGDKWYDPFNLSTVQFLDPNYALTDVQVNAITGFNKWYKAGSEVVNIAGPTLTGVTIGDGTNNIQPIVSGTTLTFTVTPATIYTEGNATLSEDVSYTIVNDTYSIGTGPTPCTATTSENLMDTALYLVRLQTLNNSINGVLGSTLISNSPLTITLTGANGTTIYTVVFQQ